MAEALKKGFFIAFEGPDGCGKSTQSRLMSEELVSGGYEILHTAEPGGTELGGRIRELLLNREEIRLDPLAELFLFEADRAQHLQEMILPAVDQGKIVVCDRYNTATYAYQGYGLGMDMTEIRALDDISTGGIVPDLTIIFDIDIMTGLSRAGAKTSGDRMEKRDNGFHERVREGYLEIAAGAPDRIKVIRVDSGIEETFERVKELVYGLINGN